jgi:hypothetical protein
VLTQKQLLPRFAGRRVAKSPDGREDNFFNRPRLWQGMVRGFTPGPDFRTPIVADNLWFLDYVHVFSSLLWTGIDLFMGFVLGPILRRLDLPARREIMRRLTPRIVVMTRFRVGI